MVRHHLLEDGFFPFCRSEIRGLNWPMFSAIAFCTAVWIVVAALLGLL